MCLPTFLFSISNLFIAVTTNHWWLIFRGILLELLYMCPITLHSFHLTDIVLFSLDYLSATCSSWCVSITCSKSNPKSRWSCAARSVSSILFVLVIPVVQWVSGVVVSQLGYSADLYFYRSQQNLVLYYATS